MNLEEGQLADGLELLVVEDEPLVRLLLVEELADQGFRVSEAEDAVSALKILNQHPEIRLVITDVVMPGDLTGLDLANWISEHRPGTIVLVTSGYVSDTQALLGSKSYHRFFSKPYPLNVLLDEVRLHLA